MSRIADLYVVKNHHLPVLRAAHQRTHEAGEGMATGDRDEHDGSGAQVAYLRALGEHGREIPFDWSGYVLFYVILYLEEREVVLGKPAFDSPMGDGGEEYGSEEYDGEDLDFAADDVEDDADGDYDEGDEDGAGSGDDGEVICVTAEAKALLPQLDPGLHDPDEIGRFFEEMGYGYDEAGAHALEVLALLRQTIEGLADDEVLLMRDY